MVVLARVRTPTERKLLDEWARTAHPGATVVPEDDPGLPEHLDGAPDPVVVPVRVTWLPRERDGERSVAPATCCCSPTRTGRGRRCSHGSPAASPTARASPPASRARARELRARFRDEAGSGRAGRPSPRSSPARRRSPASAPSARSSATATRSRAWWPSRSRHPRASATRSASSPRSSTARSTDVMDDADDCLAGAGHRAEPARRSTRSARSMRPMHARAWDVEVDGRRSSDCASSTRKHALVFLPSHRSYVDPLVLAEVLARARLPPQPPARRRQHVVLADRPARQARRGHLHPPQLRRRPGLQARRARVLRPPGRQALQHRVVHRGRPHADRQAAPAEVRAAALPRRTRSTTSRARGRAARPRLDRLRPAARGRAPWPPSRPARRSSARA